MNPPNWYMDPTSGFPLNLILLDINSWGIMLAIDVMQEKQQTNLFRIEKGSLVGNKPF